MDHKRRQYDEWVTNYAEPLYRLAVRLCGRADVAEELTQETFYHAWRSMGSLRDPDRARPWLFRILRRRYARWVRDQSRRLERVGANNPSLLGETAAAEAEPPGRALEREELLQQALALLEERYKMPLLMVFLAGMTFQEAADVLEVPLGTVLSRVHRARQTIRQHFAAQEQLPLRLVPDPGGASGRVREAIAGVGDVPPRASREFGGTS